MHALLFCRTVLTLLVLAGIPEAFALTVERDVTPDYLRSHAKEFSVKAARDPSGLIAFTVVVTLDEPRYVVAHLAVRKGDRILALSDTPTFTRNRENTFHFSLLPECLSSSEFVLGVSTFATGGEEAVPVPGTIDYRFHLPDFAPAEAVKESKTNEHEHRTRE